MSGSGTINVLALDGGGIRGILAARILQSLADKVGAPPHRAFHLIAGTSTGGIIAGAIGAAVRHGQPCRPEELVNLYVREGPRIFARHWYTGVIQYVRPKYSPRGLEAVLAEFFGSARLAAALTPLLIASYDLQAQRPFFFKSSRIAADPSYDWPLRQVARATSAAPTYFPPLLASQAGVAYAFVDGGVFANNPAMAAYAEARRLYPEAEAINLVSIGTGDRFDALSGRKARKWGELQWARQIVPVMMDSVSEGVDYELREVLRPPLGGAFFRLQPPLTLASPAMDDVSPANLRNLHAEADRYLKLNEPLLAQVAAALAGRHGAGRA
ncbi:MAG: patatin-like phospholipase family protein [Terriglobales bacterium]